MGFGGDDFMNTGMSLGQFGFMAEAEGCDDLVDTPDARFNAAIKEISSAIGQSAGEDDDVSDDVNAILHNHGIAPSGLSPRQVASIREAIE